jgi:hypothetical protein
MITTPSWPGTFGGQRSSKRYSGQQDAPEPGSGEVDVRDDLEHEEGDRPQRAAQARDQADLMLRWRAREGIS